MTAYASRALRSPVGIGAVLGLVIFPLVHVYAAMIVGINPPTFDGTAFVDLFVIIIGLPAAVLFWVRRREFGGDTP